MEILDLSFNSIYDIQVLENYELLNSLNLVYNNITDLRPLGKLINITAIDVENQIYSSPAVDYQNPLTLENVLYLPNDEFAEIKAISDYGTNVNGVMTWENISFDKEFISYSSYKTIYQFNETLSFEISTSFRQYINPLVFNSKIMSDSNLLFDEDVRVGDLIPNPGIPTSESEYCQFVGWSSIHLIDGNWEFAPNWEFETSVMPANDIMIIAEWSCIFPPAYNVIFDLNGESGTYPASFSFNPSLVLKVTVVEDETVITEVVQEPNVEVDTSNLVTTGNSNRPIIIGVSLILLAIVLLYFTKKY